MGAHTQQYKHRGADWVIPDPGNAGAISNEYSGVCVMTTAAAETRTLAIPSYVGQRLTLVLDVDGGDAVVTVAAAFNPAGHTIITFNTAGDCVTLIGVTLAGALVWFLETTDAVGGVTAS